MTWQDDPAWSDPEAHFLDPGCEPQLMKTCRYCGMKKLHWVRSDHKWKLADTKDHIHICGNGVVVGHIT